MTTRSRRTSLLRAALLAVVTILCASTATTSLAQTPTAGLDAELDRIAHETAAVRELPPLADIDDVMVTRDQVLAMMPALIAEDLDPAETAAQSRAFAAIGLIPEGTDLYDLAVRLLGEQVAGFYDPRTDEMYVVGSGDLGAAEYFYAHEVVHALQDAYLDPDDRMEDLSDLNSDQELATISLYEGDAVAASNDYLTAHPELLLPLLGESQAEYPELDTAPAAVSAGLLFPYAAGLEFVTRLRSEGGWDAVDAAYADLPASTEQILHPLKYLDRDRPVTLTLPDAGVLGPEWRTVAAETLGEFQTALLLANLAPGEGFDAITGNLALPEATRNAAAGWDGDRFALWENGNQEAVVWRSVWDTAEDARAFGRALAAFGNKRWNGVFNGESADDVALVTPDVAARILVADQEVLYVQAPTLALADAAMAALRTAPAPESAPGPD